MEFIKLETDQNVTVSRRGKPTRRMAALRACFAVLLILGTKSNAEPDAVTEPLVPVTSITFGVAEGLSPEPTIAVDTPLELTTYIHDCVGNVEACPDGFSVNFRYTAPPGDPDVTHLYAVSSGGQSAMSHGFYFRQNGGWEYEVGVGVGRKLWSVSFFLVSDAPMAICLTWNRTLHMFVDGLEIAFDDVGADRIYTEPEVDLFPQIVVGKANDDVRSDVTYPPIKLSDLKIDAEILAPTVIQAFADPVLLTACSAIVPAGKTALSPGTGLYTGSRTSCRQECARATPATPGLCFHKDQGGCACVTLDDVPDMTSGQVECAAGEWSIYWVSHAGDSALEDWSIEMAVTVVKPTSKSYIRPGETVVLDVTLVCPEAVGLEVDFGDGSRVTTGDTRIGHSWLEEGHYAVVITATSRTQSTAQSMDIAIEFVDEGVPPDPVWLKVAPVYNTSAVGDVIVYAEAFSPREKDCQLQLDPEHDLNYDGIKDLVVSREFRHIFPGIGLYPVDFSCSNLFGTTVDTKVAVAVNPEMQHESLSRTDDVIIPLHGAHASYDTVDVLIDDEPHTADVQLGEDSLTMAADLFPYSGEHVVTLVSQRKVLLTKVFNLLHRVDEVSIEAEVVHAEVNETISVDFRIGGGDLVHVYLSFGDGEYERLLIPTANGGITLRREHAYGSLGKFYLEIEVANAISSYQTKQMVSIERPLGHVEMTAENVTWIGTPTPLLFLVDMDRTPAMPFEVAFDYGNGEEEVVMLGVQQEEAGLMTHHHTYPLYGIYRVTAMVRNNISFEEEHVLVQVGQNITAVDLAVDKDKVEVGEEVTFTVIVPRGMPLEIELNTGEAELTILHASVGATPRVIDTMLDSPEDIILQDEDDIPEDGSPVIPRDASSVVGGDPAASRRKKRQAIQQADEVKEEEGEGPVLRDPLGQFPDAAVTETPEEATTLTADTGDEAGLENTVVDADSGEVAPKEILPKPTMPPNDMVQIKHKYKKPGTYFVHVRVWNTFSEQVTSLCPEVTVAAIDRQEPSCATFDVSVLDQTSQSQPLVMTRSSDIRVSTSNEIQCQDAVKLKNFTPRYTWKTMRRSLFDRWCPELEVCEIELPDSQLLIPGNTLWYGIYKLSVTMTLRSLVSSARRRRRASGLGLETTTVLIDSEASGDVDGGVADDWSDVLEDDVEDELKQIVPRVARTDLVNSLPTMLQSETVDTYIEIVPSPLVADIGNWDPEFKKSFSKTDMIKVDLSLSHDPDVVASNKTGMKLLLFCYVKTGNEGMSDLSLDDLLAASTLAQTNMAADTLVYDTDSCFLNGTQLFISEHEVNIQGALVNMNDDIVLDLIVVKDTRMARTRREARVWPADMGGNELDALANLLKSGDVNGILAFCNILTSGGEVGSDLTTGVIDAISVVSQKINNMDQLEKTTGVMRSVTSSKNVNPESKATAASALGTTAGKAKAIAKLATLDTVVNSVGGPLVEAAGNCLPFAEEEEEDELVTQEPASARYTDPLLEDEDEDLIEEDVGCCEKQVSGFCEWIEPPSPEVDDEDQKSWVWSDLDCDCAHSFDVANITRRYQAWLHARKMKDYALKQRTSEGGMKACSDIGNVIMGKQDSGSEINLNSPKMNVSVARLDQASMADRIARSLGGKQSLGAFKVPLSAIPTDGGGDVGAMIMESPNPFTYTDSAANVKGKVLTLEFGGNQGTIAVENTAEPIMFWLDGKPDPAPRPTFVYRAFDKKGQPEWQYHAVNVSANGSSIHFILIPDVPGDEYYVSVKYMDFPNTTYHDAFAELPVEDPDFNAESLPPDVDAEEVLHDLRHTFFPPQNVTAYNGTYRIGIRLKGTKVIYERDQNEVSESDHDRNHTYSLHILISGCRYMNKTSNEWDSDGVEVGKLTNVQKTQCLSSHLTSFGGDFAVAPNSIDFKTVFSAAKFVESVPVFVTVMLVLLLYLATIIWARHMDKKDLLKWGATPLEDSLPSDQYHYQMTVYTGVKKNAGTKSKISFILSGDASDTGVRRLSDGKRKEHPAGSIYNYILSTETCLGPLTYLRIWHDNAGKGKSKGWFLDQIIITDMQSGEKFVFLNDRWLAVEEDDGMVDRIIPVAGLNDLIAFKHLFSSSVRKKLTNDHLWFSVVSRPTRSSFTRVQRISCCVCLLFLTMITNCMFFKADERVENVQALNIGPFSFTLHQLFISVVTTAIVFPPNILVVTIFKKARPKKNKVMQNNQTLSKKSRKFQWRSINPGSALWNNSEKGKMQKFRDTMRNIVTYHQKAKYSPDASSQGKKKKKGFTLPSWTLYIGWGVCILSILGSGFFTILYSMEWGRQKSLDWLGTFLLSFFQSVIVVQPIKVLMLAAFISCILKKPELEEEEESFEDNNCVPDRSEEMMTTSQQDLHELIKKRRMAADDVAPPDYEALDKARDLRMKELTMEAILKECIVYFFFVLVVFFLSYQARDTDSFFFAQNIKNTFDSSSFHAVSKPDDFWGWIQGSFLPGFYATEWYNGQPMVCKEELQIDDRSTIRLGVARIRQQRIKADSCNILSFFEGYINHCRDSYNWVDDDTSDYLPEWQRPEDVTMGNDSVVIEPDPDSSWAYKDSIDLTSAPYAGRLSMYKGGGYPFTFKRSLGQTRRLLQQLQDRKWLDVMTRAVFIEFTLYNANVNLFGSVVMLIEYMSTGGAIQNLEVKVFRLSGYVGGFGVVVLIFDLAYLAFILYFLIKMIRDLRKQRLKYFQDFWNLLEFVTLILSVVAIAMYALKKVFGTVAMSTMHERGPGDYVNFVTLSVWDEAFSLVLASVVFLATIKFIKMLKFNKRMGMLGDTIRLATKDLKIFTIIFSIYFLAFCQAAYILFGRMLSDYGSFLGSIESLFAFALGSFDFYSFQAADRILGPVFFFLYVGIVYIGLMGMFLTIIYDAFASIKANADLQSNDYEIVDFIWRKFKGIFGWAT